MIPEYKYRVHDESIATPYFKKLVVAPLFRFVPEGIPANIITFLSNILMYVALAMALTEWPDRTLRFILIPLLVIGYAIGDHMDGMQAKRSGTSSALGELCDHYLDIFNTGILLFMVCLSFHIFQPWLVAFYLTIAYLSHAAIFYEQFSTKWLYFGKIGALESVILLSLCILTSAIHPVYHWLLQPAFFGLNLIESVFVLATLGALLTYAEVILRARIRDVWFYVFCALLITTAVTGSSFLTPVALFYVITFYSSLYIGNLQRGHLADGKKRFPDIIAPLFILAAFIFEPLRQPVYLWALYIYLACHALWIAGYSFWTLRKFWVWRNPVSIKN